MQHQFEIDFDIKHTTVIPTHPDVFELDLIHCTEDNFNELTIPYNITTLVFIESDLEYLIIPNHITYCNCSNLGLKDIVLSDAIETLYCQHNCLKQISIPTSCEYLYVDYNKLTSITPKSVPNLIELYVTNNRIKEITLDYFPKLAIVEHDVNVILPLTLKMQLAIKEKEEYDRFKY